MLQNINLLRSKTQGGHPLKQYGFGVRKNVQHGRAHGSKHGWGTKNDHFFLYLVDPLT